jgi:hypothetical protein
MSFLTITQELLNKTLTENGDASFVSTGSPCLDYFALIGGKRDDLPGAAAMFAKAFVEDPKTAVELLFYTRDPRAGIGERRLFRFLLNGLALSYPEVAKPLLPFVAKYGRYDDLLALLHTPVEDEVIDLIDATLQEDLENKKAGKPISLLAKWLPSINTSNAEARHAGLYLAKKLGMGNEKYRKTLSFLRKGTIVESNLREKDYTFDYAAVPSVAMMKYQKAFIRNDKERFGKYLTDVASGKEEMNVSVSSPVTLVHRYRENNFENADYFETTFEAFVKDGKIHKRTLVVRDGSGSMYCSFNGAPIDVADAMSLLTSARLSGEFHDKFITFSAKPELVDLSSAKTLKDKLFKLEAYNEVANTNIEKVYNLIVDVYASPSFKDEDAIEQILIISDMEFDGCVADLEEGTLRSTFEAFDKRFADMGKKRPEVIFWNVASRSQHVPVSKNEYGVKLISGSSKNIIDLVMSDDSLDPEKFMRSVLAAYEEIGNAIGEVKS